MVSLKSFLNYFSQSRPAVTLSPAEQQQIERLIQAFGGEANIVNVDACITRLRVTVKDVAIIDEPRLKATGAKGIIKQGNNVQVVYGLHVKKMREAVETFL